MNNVETESISLEYENYSNNTMAFFYKLKKFTDEIVILPGSTIPDVNRIV